jgi:hypothetical protein
VTTRERRPHYECNHRTTICRDCDGSPPATTPWVTFVATIKEDDQ